MFLGIVLGAIFVPTYSAYAQSVIVDTSDSNDYEARLQTCSFGVLAEMNLPACLVEGVYYLVLTPSAWFARITGELFDYFVQYSLDTNSYRGNGNFIERGWSVVRDIGNVLFIFALLYIAITHILQAGNSGTKKLLINLIVAALLINFSLFFSRIIIDAGNILARAFYNNIEIPNDDNIEYRTISQGIVMHVNPQRILGSDLFVPRHNTTASGTPPNMVGKVDNGYALVVLGSAAAVNITLGITFLSVALLFVGRVVGLWFLMIFSPFALASIAVPESRGIFGQFSFSGWVNQTMKLSFMAPVFLFFLFLLIMFLQIIFQTNIPPENQSTTQQLMSVIIPFAMVIFILNKAKSVAADLAGDAGAAVKGIFGKAAGFTLGAAGLVGGAALGVTAFAGRNIVGRAANATLEQGKFQQRVRLNNIRASSYDRKAREATTREERVENEKKAAQARSAAARNAVAVKQLDRARKGTFDFRRSDLLQKKIIGSDAGKAIGTQFGNLAKEFTGEKLSIGFGKGKDTNRKKFEDEKEKERLDTAKLYDKQDRETIELIAYSARQGMKGQAELIDHINKYSEDIKDSKLMDDVEKKDRLELIDKWRERAITAKTTEEISEVLTGIKERDSSGNVVQKDGKDVILHKGRDDVAKKEQGQRRNSYADVVQSKNINNPVLNTIFNFNIGERDAMATADKIRKKPEDALDKIKKILDQENPPETPPPPTPTPAPAPTTPTP